MEVQNTSPIIFASSGQGMAFQVKGALPPAYMGNSQIIVIDPKKEYETLTARHLTGGFHFTEKGEKPCK